MDQNKNVTYKCVCGREFNDAQAFNGHKAHCKEHHLRKDGNLERYNSFSQDRATKAGQSRHNNEELKKQQKLNEWISEKHTCEKCGKVMTEYFGSGRFCSRSCANGKPHSEETIRKIKLGMQDSSNGFCIDYFTRTEYYENPKRCIVCNVIIPYEHKNRKTCSEECRKKRLSEVATGRECSEETRDKLSRLVQERILNGTHKGWMIRKNQESYAEQFWRRVLENNKIPFQQEYKVNKEDCGCYFLDFLLPNNVDLEIDGKQHKYESSKERDTKRDKYISSLGYIIYRIPWINPGSDIKKEEVKQQIEQFLQWYNSII